MLGNKEQLRAIALKQAVDFVEYSYNPIGDDSETTGGESDHLLVVAQKFLNFLEGNDNPATDKDGDEQSR